MTTQNLTDDGSDPLRSAVATHVRPAFHVFEQVVRRRHPDAVFGTGLCWGGAQRVFAYQRMRWAGMTEDLIFGVSVLTGDDGASIHVDLVGEDSGHVHLGIPPLPLPADSLPDRISGLAGLLAVSFGQLAIVYLDLGC